MKQSAKYILISALAILSSINLNAQISINSTVHEQDKVVYGNYPEPNYNSDMYASGYGEDPCVCITDSGVYYLLFSILKREQGTRK